LNNFGFFLFFPFFGGGEAGGISKEDSVNTTAISRLNITEEFYTIKISLGIFFGRNYNCKTSALKNWRMLQSKILFFFFFEEMIGFDGI